MSVVTVSQLDEFHGMLGLTAPAAWTTARKQARIDAAQRKMELATGRVFTPVDATRQYNGTGGQILPIDDATAVTTVTIGTAGDALTEGSDYVAQPLNSVPKNRLERLWSWPTGVEQQVGFYYQPVWPKGSGNIYVTGSFGYFTGGSAVVEVQEAVMMLATLYLLSGPAMGIVGSSVGAAFRSMSAGGMSVSFGSGGAGGKPALQAVSGWGEFVDEVVAQHTRVAVA